jgi:T-complex protein 1 subunit alpha
MANNLATLSVGNSLVRSVFKDSADLVAKLRAYHNAIQTNPEKPEYADFKDFGLDLKTGTVRNNRSAGVFEPAISKIKSLKFATEAAITILRIDDLIKLEPERGEEKSYQQAYQAGELDG